MSRLIDTSFDVHTDAGGKDPDSHSATLRGFHRLLWSKPLPRGVVFELDDKLHHESDLGEFWLASDAITHTYSNRDSPAELVAARLLSSPQISPLVTPQLIRRYVQSRALLVNLIGSEVPIDGNQFRCVNTFVFELSCERSSLVPTRRAATSTEAVSTSTISTT